MQGSILGRVADCSSALMVSRSEERGSVGKEGYNEIDLEEEYEAKRMGKEGGNEGDMWVWA
jgi:hypothetical protein